MFDDIRAASRGLALPTQPVEPNPDNTRVYAALYERWREIYGRMADLTQSLDLVPMWRGD